MNNRSIKINITPLERRIKDLNLCATSESQSLTIKLDMDALFGCVTVEKFLEGYKGDLN